MEKALFDAALGLADPAVRREFLERACGGDAALRDRLEALLESNAEAERFFDMDPLRLPGGQEGAPAGEEVSAEGPGGRGVAGAEVWIGRYKLMERMGEGGCGVVYLAEQEEPVRRQVALKIIRLGMDTQHVIARFEMERQALAMMNHPHIAQVLDAGTDGMGRPYFVMELVQGERITDYCDRLRLGPAKRLELFIQVCLAIQHAHQKGILHRDIKPSNILVAGDGENAVPKVIDFGIAKAIEGNLGDERSVALAEPFIGTPAYMSPEQAEMGGLDADTRSDIYSLGALLYELLTGRPPFEGSQLLELGVEEMRRALREWEPPRPSELLQSLESRELEVIAAKRRCDPSRLIAGLRGDLDCIVMKALEKDRQRRYATVNGLAIDVQRHLRNEPVMARPPSRLYSLGKLVRRNRVSFAAGMAVAAALLIGFGTSTWLFFQERRLLAEAEKNEKVTRAMFLVRGGNFREANAVLEQVDTPPSRPSLDGVSAFREVGDWLARQQRWREAADRYAFVLHLDLLDIWGSVTLDYQAYGVLLVETGNLAEYERFSAAAISRYAAETNDDAAVRILKTCLLRPPAAERLAALRPMGEKAERFARTYVNQWACIPASLWRYRCGEYRETEAIALWPKGDPSSAAAATLDLIASMALAREGKTEEARPLLERGRALVGERFRSSLPSGGFTLGNWYDWVFARILLREAESTVPRELSGTGTEMPP
jgi:serine/threonine protein kinase